MPTQLQDEMCAPAHSPTSKRPAGTLSSMLVALFAVKLELMMLIDVKR